MQLFLLLNWVPRDLNLAAPLRTKYNKFHSIPISAILMPSWNKTVFSIPPLYVLPR